MEKEVPEEDPLELQFISMAKWAKLELPGKQAFRVALKLASQLDDYIEEYECKQMVANTQYDNSFLNTGANQVNVNAVPAQVHTLQLPKPPPVLQAQPAPMMQQQAQQGGHFVQQPQGKPQFLQQQAPPLQPTSVSQADDSVLDRVLNFVQI